MQFSIRLPEYIPYEPRINYDYLMIKPVGTECFIVVEKPNSFKFYHITTDPVCNQIPFLTIHIPGVCVMHSPIILHGTIIRPTLCVIYDIIQRPNAKELNETRLTNLHKLMSSNPHLYANEAMTFGVAHFIDVSASANLLYDVGKVPYNIKHIEYKSYSTIASIERQPVSFDLSPPMPIIEPSNTICDKYNNSATCVFILYADIYPDIYNIYTEDRSFVGVAHVPDYKTSVFLNNIFRRIKENANLDLLEESDDEDEFENTSLSKFVDLTKVAKMKCVYDDKFMKWMPTQLICEL